MQYIVAIDHDHLDDGMFLSDLARAITQHNNTRSIILHGDSEYTERVIQTGVMRDEAEIRSQKDLNHRLVALFADEGISAVGMNGYQRNSIIIENDKLKLNKKFFNRLPDQSALILSTLVWDVNKSAPVPISLPKMSFFIQKKLDVNKLFSFNKSDDDFDAADKEEENKDWATLSDHFANKYLPDEFHGFNRPLTLTTARDFRLWPNLKKGIAIN